MNSSRDNKRTFIATIALLVTAGFLAGGCSGKNKAASTATAVPAAGQTGSSAAPGEVKLTPEQEAAKQRAIQQGPAIEAALNASRAGK